MCLIRVVHEAHSATTKKNKEWQEKLPIVVLKAEEIMYSKANSEVFFSWFYFPVLSFDRSLIECAMFFLFFQLYSVCVVSTA